MHTDIMDSSELFGAVSERIEVAEKCPDVWPFDEKCVASLGRESERNKNNQEPITFRSSCQTCCAC